jgi:predicted TIM-barrel fold metal-dependent hydrolase
MWERYMPSKFKDKLPRLVKDPKGGDAWELYRGVAPMPIGMVATPGQRYEDFDWFGHSYDTVRKGCFDGQARVEDMKFDGIDAEILYPSLRTMMYFMGNEDDDFHKAGVDAYNEWILRDFSAADPERLFPMFVLPNLGIETSLSELRRAKQQGYRGVLLFRFPSGNPTLSREDDPFWAEAETLQMPIHLHGMIGGPRRVDEASVRSAAESATAGAHLVGGTLGSFGQIMATFIHSGLFDRYPAVKMVGVEVQAGWIPAVLEFWDDRYWRNRTTANLDLKLLPSEYFHRNWLVTFIVDRYGVKNRHDVGIKNMMWSTDYPHHGNDWPYSRKVLASMFDGVPETERFQITCGNATELYGLTSRS